MPRTDTADTFDLYPCRYGHFDCAEQPRGECGNERFADQFAAVDDDGNPVALDRTDWFVVTSP